ncbi:hypothetical protein D9M68_749860 [compost metagenome]
MTSNAAYVSCYRTIYESVDRHYDVRGSVLSDVVHLCLLNHGKLAQARREQFRRYAPEEVFDYVEAVATAVLYGSQGLLGRSRTMANSRGREGINADIRVPSSTCRHVRPQETVLRIDSCVDCEGHSSLAAKSTVAH